MTKSPLRPRVPQTASYPAGRIDVRRAWPSGEAIPAAALEHCVHALEGQDGDLFGYGDSYGYGPLREWIASREQVDVSNVILGTGSLHLLDMVVSGLLTAGDVVIVETPTYDRALAVLRRRGIEVVGIPLEDDGPDVDALRRAAVVSNAKAVYLVPDFQNPTGVTTSLEKRFAITACSEALGLLILEDSPCRELRYRGGPLPSLRSLGGGGVLHLSSFSKYLSPGLRVGYLIGAAKHVRYVSNAAQDTYISPVLLTQAVVAEFCIRDLLPQQLERLRALYGPRLRHLCALLRTTGLSLRPEPEGGLFTSATLPGRATGAEFRVRMATLGVDVIDGERFFALPAEGAQFLRLPVTCSTSGATAIVARIREALE